MSLAPRPLQGKTKLMKQSLTLPHAEADTIPFLKMVRQQHPIPKVLVVAQIPWRTPYLAAQPLLRRRSKSARSPRAITLLQSSQPPGNKALHPVLHAPGRVTVNTGRLIGTGSVEDVKNHMESMVISPFLGPRYFVLDSGDECLGIWNSGPSHWKHLPWVFAPSILHYLTIRNYL